MRFLYQQKKNQPDFHHENRETIKKWRNIQRITFKNKKMYKIMLRHQLTITIHRVTDYRQDFLFCVYLPAQHIVL